MLHIFCYYLNYVNRRYLTSRKTQWAQMEEEKLKNLPDPDCPIGHIMMPELERLETLNRLKQSMIFITLSSKEFFYKQYFLNRSN
jgi:hypothetical protein